MAKGGLFGRIAIFYPVTLFSFVYTHVFVDYTFEAYART